MGLIDRFRKPIVAVVQDAERSAISLDLWAEMVSSFTFQGVSYTMPQAQQEEIGWQYTSLSRAAYKANGVVFACMMVRSLLFSEARFMFRRLREGRPQDLWGNRTLEVLNNPWPNGTTGDLLARMIQHVDLAGNAFVARRSGKLAMLRPDWVTIIGGVDGNPDATVWHPDAEVLAYAYQEGGVGSGKPITFFDVSEVAHFAPYPDPEARFRGMSWLTPIVREIMADKSMTDFKLASMENGATPNMIVKMDVDDLSKYANVIKEFRANHEGSENRGKTLFLNAGADATVVGQSFEELNFKVTQGAGETRIAAAAGVPPVIVGLSEGLEQATYSNYAQARRRLSDGTMRPLWRNAAASLAVLLDVPADSELWYDDRDIKFLQEDQKDAADIRMADAQTVRTLVEAGYDPKTAVEAVLNDDFSKLTHTGLVSVQLQEPGAEQPPKNVLAKNGLRSDAFDEIEQLLLHRATGNGSHERLALEA